MNKELLEIQESMAALKKVWVSCSLLPNNSLELSSSANMLAGAVWQIWQHHQLGGVVLVMTAYRRSTGVCNQ
jgi:hypothetical protein